MPVNRFRPHHPDEYLELLRWSEGASSILEVGSRYGFTLYDLAKTSGAKRVVGVDLPGPDEQWGFEDSETAFRGNVEKLKKEGVDAHAIVGDSHAPMVVEMVKALGPYDFIFIDANHKYEHVKQDWENFGHLGKKVAFHDIRKPAPGENQDLQVWKLWQELTGKKTEFFGKGTKMGIGLIEVGDTTK